MDESGIKQVLVYRRDLNMRKGKIAAQCGHAVGKVFFDRGEIGYTWRTGEHGTLFETEDDPGNPGELVMLIPLTSEMAGWVRGTYAKIVLTVENEADLLRVHEMALAAGIPTVLITDLGHTEFKADCPACDASGHDGIGTCSHCGGSGRVGVPTRTAVALGPAKAEDIDKITGPQGKVPTKLP